MQLNPSALTSQQQQSPGNTGGSLLKDLLGGELGGYIKEGAGVKGEISMDLEAEYQEYRKQSDQTDNARIVLAYHTWLECEVARLRQSEARELAARKKRALDQIMRPHIVCLCGSTRFSEAYQQANLRETLEGCIVLTIGCDMKSDHALFDGKTQAELDEIKTLLDKLHLAKIDMADEIFVLNVGGYIGESTRREIEYAEKNDKYVRYLEPANAKSEAL